MAQKPVADFDNPEHWLRRVRSGRRAYSLAACGIVALIVLVLIGITGPRQTAPTPSPTASQLLGLGPVQTPETNATPDPDHVDGLANLRVPAADIASVGLGSSVVPMAAYAGNLLYSSGDELYLANPKKSGAPRAIVHAATCARMIQAAMNASIAIYAEIGPAAAAQSTSRGCWNWTSSVDWSISTVDLMSRETHEIASGTFASSDAAWRQPTGISVAIADQVYAFSRRDPDADLATVEVRTLSQDKLIYSSDPLAGISQVEVADNRLVVVASPDPTVGRPDRRAVLDTDTWDEPLAVVGYTTGSVALSRDGNQLAFTSCNPATACATITLLGGQQPQQLALPLEAESVALDTGNLQTIAWTTDTSPDHPTSYIGLQNSRWPTSIVLVGVAPPDWIGVQADTLLFVSVSPAGIVELYEIDLTTVHLGS